MKHLLIAIGLIVLAGCAGKTKDEPIAELSICANGECVPAQQAYSRELLFTHLEALLQANEGVNIPICVAKPHDKTCINEDVCYLVMGGIVPGSGCAQHLTFTNVRSSDTAAINMDTTMPLSFIGTKVSCGSAVSRISVISINEVTLALDAYHCSWMVMGQMSATFSFRVESIDIEKGVLAGYWRHGVSGTGNGRGAGYALLTFTNNVGWKETAL
ncbi:hypothetical protein [Teredinibacter purpureus]|uniref:hypothetical protein n=1 Tax=Teredinibacter purpureus TaxID=2731756 RepID=UPI0005F82369|nr:hypothetical protein [Teredinibacter purpureus]